MDILDILLKPPQPLMGLFFVVYLSMHFRGMFVYATTNHSMEF